jgi:hypothetical protein
MNAILWTRGLQNKPFRTDGSLRGPQLCGVSHEMARAVSIEGGAREACDTA